MTLGSRNPYAIQRNTSLNTRLSHPFLQNNVSSDRSQLLGIMPHTSLSATHLSASADPDVNGRPCFDITHTIDVLVLGSGPCRCQPARFLLQQHHSHHHSCRWNLRSWLGTKSRCVNWRIGNLRTKFLHIDQTWKRTDCSISRSFNIPMEERFRVILWQNISLIYLSQVVIYE